MKLTKEILENIMDETLMGNNPPDSAPTVIGKEECIIRILELANSSSDIKNVSDGFKCEAHDLYGDKKCESKCDNCNSNYK